MILNEPWPRFQGHTIIRRSISQKRYKIDTWLLQTTNRKWHVTSSVVPFVKLTLITFKVISAILSENKRSLLFRSPIECPGDLMKDDIAGDLDWPLTVISATVNGFIVCNSKIQHVLGPYVRNELQGSDVISEQLFLLSYSTGRTVVWCWARPVCDS